MSKYMMERLDEVAEQYDKNLELEEKLDEV